VGGVMMKEYPESELTNRIILAAIEVHRALGPGLLESAYEACLCKELELQGLAFRKQVDLPVFYKGLALDCGYRIDLIVDGRVIVELKAAEKILPIHDAQLLTYLRLAGSKVGLILNFNSRLMKDGIKRLVL
jgi:GxxExxY protein